MLNAVGISGRVSPCNARIIAKSLQNQTKAPKCTVRRLHGSQFGAFPEVSS